MQRVFGSFFLMGAGVFLFLVARHGYHSGELRAGRAYYRAYRPNREDNPLAFHFYLVLYLCSSVVLTVWGILALLGAAPPIKWR